MKNLFNRVRPAYLILALAVCPYPAASLTVELTPPVIGFKGGFLAAFGDEIEGFNAHIAALADEFEKEVSADEELRKFGDQFLLPAGFANAGSAHVHIGTPRGFIDYKNFVLLYGVGVAASMPGSYLFGGNGIEDSLDSSSDVYAGFAVQPMALTFGLNLERRVRGLRAHGRFGYFNLDRIQNFPNASFESLSMGAGASYQLIRPKPFLRGALLWRGLSTGSGLFYQHNRGSFKFRAAAGDFESSEITLADFDLDQPVLDEMSADFGITEETVFGTLGIAPEVIGSFDSWSLSVPMELNTGIRVLWGITLTVGVGADLVFGGTKLAFRAGTDVYFTPGTEVAEHVTVAPGSVRLSVSSESAPQLLRPRLSAGAALGLGPLRLEIPAMYFLDVHGSTWMLGVNLGLAW